jgi:hypothetical protein
MLTDPAHIRGPASAGTLSRAERQIRSGAARQAAPQTSTDLRAAVAVALARLSRHLAHRAAGAILQASSTTRASRAAARSSSVNSVSASAIAWLNFPAPLALPDSRPRSPLQNRATGDADRQIWRGESAESSTRRRRQIARSGRSAVARRAVLRCGSAGHRVFQGGFRWGLCPIERGRRLVGGPSDSSGMR